MRLPGADRAVIESAKVRDYLLSSVHPVGRFKAAFFRSLGYSESDSRVLEADLRSLARSGEAEPAGESEFGTKYQVAGSLTGPSGGQAEVVTVWVVLKGET
ncbi:MAG TPA: adhesin, partial [Candidatus Polarisedimenticolia bacterium]|nr:adhesin [Candidatus Polarisedimenticolia bacterium]